MNKNLIVLAVIVPMLLAQPAPVFPQQYELAFSEKAALGPISGNTTGRIYLDATNNRQFISRANGHYDRYCGSVNKFVDTPCNHIVLESTHFLIYLRQEILGLPWQEILLLLL